MPDVFLLDRERYVLNMKHLLVEISLYNEQCEMLKKYNPIRVVIGMEVTLESLYKDTIPLIKDQ